MRLRTSAAAAIAAGMLIVLWGCGAARPVKYYSLDAPEVTPSGQPLDVALLIGHFRAPTIYRDTRMVYRTGPNELGLYEGHRWVEAPALMVEEMMLRTLRRSHSYKSVQLMASNAEGDYVVRGRVEHFEEVDGKPLSARVALHVSLYDPKSGETVWSHTFEHDENASGGTVADVAAALDRGLQQGILEIAAGINQYLAEHPRPPAAK
ncbi:MAG TPA: ABC-type transport auxiliary lipoprotein family protein [Candidatus Acidoferrales bacterium]|nr:ABC-type transport auxiliary lipoprotein family protein [Candidatus Acidoferrales bacterium]